MPTLISKIFSKRCQEYGVPGLYVEAWELDNLYHNPSGENTTTYVALDQIRETPGTAIEGMTVPWQKAIIRLLPDEGVTMQIINPVTNLSVKELAEAPKWLTVLKNKYHEKNNSTYSIWRKR